MKKWFRQHELKGIKEYGITHVDHLLKFIVILCIICEVILIIILLTNFPVDPLAPFFIFYIFIIMALWLIGTYFLSETPEYYRDRYWKFLLSLREKYPAIAEELQGEMDRK